MRNTVRLWTFSEKNPVNRVSLSGSLGDFQSHFSLQLPFPFRILNKMVILLYSAGGASTSNLRVTCIPVFVCGRPANDLG